MAEKRPRGGAAGAGGDAVSSRNLRRRGAAGDPDRAGKWGRSRRAWVSVLGGLAAAVAAVGTAAAMSGHHRAAHAAATITTTTAPPAPTAVCPLLGTPAPGNSVPARPALAVKIGNLTGDRPSAGLDQADIVYEEPVEGGITRLVAVFQCRSAPLVGDLRSARQPDVGILSQLSHPLFLHAGGIAPVLSLLAEAPLTDENVLAGGASSAIVDQPG
ncbi:MAG TPA: DUF3048 domain-containing protein, partial [Acidimicrobiales bacterium]|nr:DUF3048 domain-containing protein [Acidimicrobiales bacterium]